MPDPLIDLVQRYLSRELSLAEFRSRFTSTTWAWPLDHPAHDLQLRIFRDLIDMDELFDGDENWFRASLVDLVQQTTTVSR